MQPITPNIIETTNLESLKKLVLFLLEKVEQLSVENAELKRENAELKARLNQNSQNSSRPLRSRRFVIGAPFKE